MSNYDMWVNNRLSQVYKNKDIFIELGIETKWDTESIRTRRGVYTHSVSKEVIYVVECERENEYCEPMKIIDKKDFGERNAANLKLAEEYFRNKIMEVL